jgi:hypothetical protein
MSHGPWNLLITLIFVKRLKESILIKFFLISVHQSSYYRVMPRYVVKSSEKESKPCRLKILIARCTKDHKVDVSKEPAYTKIKNDRPCQTRLRIAFRLITLNQSIENSSDNSHDHQARHNQIQHALKGTLSELLRDTIDEKACPSQ